MWTEFKELETKIKEVIGRGRVYYIANPGNWGDALIRCGTIRFLNDCGIKFTEIRYTNRLHWLKALIFRGVLIYGGGGAWCKNWNHGYRIVKRKRWFFKRVIVLPSTYEMSADIPGTIFFRRDKYESASFMPQSIFCHDMAFYLKDKINSRVEVTRKEGNFFRLDHESALDGMPAGNVDITHDKSAHTPVQPFIDAIGECEIINTDKLHVAILGSLLGKEVNFYPGNYFKNRALFKSSIEPYFPNTRFVEVVV